jgi:hypothetical protein
MRGRKPKWESRSAELRHGLIAWKQTPVSLRPSLRSLARKLNTSHQLLMHYLSGLDSWRAEEEGRRIRARAKAAGRPMTLRESLDATVLPGFFRQIEHIRREAKRGPLNSHQIKMLKVLAQHLPEAQNVLENCRQMTPQEEQEVRASERKARASQREAMFTSAALSHIDRIKRAAEGAEVCERDIAMLKVFAVSPTSCPRNVQYAWDSVRFTLGTGRYEHADWEDGLHGSWRRRGTRAQPDRRKSSRRPAPCPSEGKAPRTA